MKDILNNVQKLIKHPAFISIVLTIVAIVGIIGIFRLIPEENTGENVQIVERYWGNPDSKVIIECYSDLECPACASFWIQIEKPLKEKYSDKIKFVFKHLPLTRIHARAETAAQAAEAAGEQGFFFEYVEKLYEKQSTESKTWSTSKFVEYAKEVGVPDIDKFKKALETKKYKGVINEYKKIAEEKKLTATPTLFINGEQVKEEELFNLESLEKRINELLNNNNTSNDSK